MSNKALDDRISKLGGFTITQAKYSHPEMAGMEIVERGLSDQALEMFVDALETGNETEIHHVLAENPIIFQPILQRVGHNAMWYHNKPKIKSKSADGTPGLIPDLMLAGTGSGGTEWFIVELKGPKSKLFKPNGKGLSPDADEGIAQLDRYLRHARQNQQAIQHQGWTEFQDPTGIFVIGQRTETDGNKPLTAAKSDLNLRSGNMQIISYTRLLEAAIYLNHLFKNLP